MTASLNGTAEHSAAYSYDIAYRLGTVTHGTDTFIYGYEPTTYGLVKTVTGPAHTVTNSYEANALNQYTSVPSSPSALSHDADGNLTAGHLHAITTGGTTASSK